MKQSGGPTTVPSPMMYATLFQISDWLDFRSTFTLQDANRTYRSTQAEEKNFWRIYPSFKSQRSVSLRLIRSHRMMPNHAWNRLKIKRSKQTYLSEYSTQNLTHLIFVQTRLGFHPRSGWIGHFPWKFGHTMCNKTTMTPIYSIPLIIIHFRSYLITKGVIFHSRLPSQWSAFRRTEAHEMKMSSTTPSIEGTWECGIRSSEPYLDCQPHTMGSISNSP